MRSYGRVLFALVALIASGIASLSQAVGAPRSATMAIDANTGDVLHAEAADQPRYPASLTKMMTIYLAFEAVEKGRTSLNRKIKISQEAASAAPTKLDLDPGEDIALIDAIKALITKSANDIAIAVAEHIAGTEAKFAELMTEKARAIGMSQTTFKNASGLPDSGQVTTARDMLTLAMRLQDEFPKHYPLFAMRSFTYNGSSHANHNTLLGSIDGIDGIKTGYTRMSGFNLVTSIRRDGKHVVAAVFGGATAGLRNVQMRLLLNRALAKASRVKTRNPAPLLVARPKLVPRPAPKPETNVGVAVAPPPAQLSPPAERVGRPAPARPGPPPVAAPTPAVEPVAMRQVVAATATPAVEPAPAPLQIQVARVRPVMVAQRVRPSPVPTPSAAGNFALPGLATALAAASDPVAIQPTPPVDLPPVAVVRSPPAPGKVVAELSRTAVPAPQAVAAAVRAHPPAPATARLPAQPTRGATPSTLQAQAEALSRGVPAVTGAVPIAAPAQPTRPSAIAQAAPQPAFSLNGPRPASPVAAAGGFQIQIGAYNSVAEAERALAATRERATELVGQFTPVATPAQKENRQIYRARFAGFDARGAASTCLELRRRQIDCFVMKAE